jgi:hypothetical protein
MEVKYKTTIVQTGNNTGIHVPEPILEKLNGGKKPLVKVTLNGYTYRSAVGKMGGRFMISLSSENRKNAGVNGGDTLEVTLALDTEPGIVELPVELQAALNKNKTAKAAFEKLAPGRKKAIALLLRKQKQQKQKRKELKKPLTI